MSFLHVLLAITFTFALIAAAEFTMIEFGVLAVLVVHMSVPLFLGGPSDLKVLALGLGTFVRACVRFHVLRQIAGTSKPPAAKTAKGFDIHRCLTLLPTCHRARNIAWGLVGGDRECNVERPFDTGFTSRSQLHCIFALNLRLVLDASFNKTHEIGVSRYSCTCFTKLPGR